MDIPVKNIYYLILYAFDYIKNKELLGDKDFEQIKDFNDTIVSLFIKEVSKIVKKGLYRNYNEVTDEIFLIKGKIDIKKSMVLSSGKLKCNFDEFNLDNQYNMVIKYVIRRLLFVEFNHNLKKELKKLYFNFEDVTYKEYSAEELLKINFNKLNRDYSFAIKLSSFILNNTIPSDKKGKYKFIDFIKNEETMNLIYEKFLLNFYILNTDYKVKGGREYNWYLKPIEDLKENYIPIMKTDVELEKDNKKIIIDAKYYKDAFTNRYNCKKYSSNNMYQINTYLDHNMDKYDDLRGILLYPSNGYEFSEKYTSENKFNIEFATVDLSKDWKLIHERLLDIIKY